MDKSIIASSIEIYTLIGTQKGFYQSGIGEYLGCIFSFGEKGCQDVVLSFSQFVDIEKTDIIKIKIFNSTDYFFTGIAREIPIAGASNADYLYKAYGLSDYFIRLNTNDVSYTSTTISAIIIDLVDTIIINKTPIKKNLSKIDNITTAIDNINFYYNTIDQALDQLQKIASSDGNEYIYGVDGEGDFYFKARSDNLIATLSVGKSGDFGIEEYNPQDNVAPKSKLIILRKDGTHYGDYQSDEDIDIYEVKLTAPDLADNDIDKWARGQLLIMEETTREATIGWKIKTDGPYYLTANELLRILSETPPSTKIEIIISLYGSGNYGSGYYGGIPYSQTLIDDTLKIMSVTYEINETKAYMTIKLGTLPISLDSAIININKKIEDLKINLGV